VKNLKLEEPNKNGRGRSKNEKRYLSYLEKAISKQNFEHPLNEPRFLGY
jgi:hypothetical protein